MEKERRITAPDGCEIEKVEIVDGVAVVTFKKKKKKRKLPKSWEDFCGLFPMNAKECYIGFDGEIISFDPETEISKRNNVRDRSVLPDRAAAEAVLALCQLIQLRDCYNGDWVPDWTDDNSIKYVIDFNSCHIVATCYTVGMSLLYFKTEELRDEFLRNFRPLIEKLKPLYGIKEGGEE